jgi:hypothetical protein
MRSEAEFSLLLEHFYAKVFNLFLDKDLATPTVLLPIGG